LKTVVNITLFIGFQPSCLGASGEELGEQPDADAANPAAKRKKKKKSPSKEAPRLWKLYVYMYLCVSIYVSPFLWLFHRNRRKRKECHRPDIALPYLGSND
jgi:hypothetical protein